MTGGIPSKVTAIAPRHASRRWIAAILAGLLLGLAVFVGTIVTRSANWLERPPPIVVLGSPNLFGFNFSEVLVVRVENARSLGEFTAELRVGSATIGRLEPLGPGADGALQFQEVDFNGRLTQGDRFVSANFGPGAYVLVVRWNGVEVARTSWLF